MRASNPVRILIVDDDPQDCEAVARMVASKGYIAEVVHNGEEALEKLSGAERYGAIITDLVMPRVDGFHLLATLAERNDPTPAIVLTGVGEIGQGVTVVHELKAFWYLQKPVDPKILPVLLERAVRHGSLVRDKALLTRQVSYSGALDEMVGRSKVMQEVFALIQQVAPTTAAVFITGESGTGKELAARAIHRLSPRADEPFVVINCAALPETLIESEMFGYERGAFTGALARRAGCFEQAHRGTLFLDEITEMPAASQAKLLRVLQDGKVRRLGGSAEITVDVRVIAATNRSPAAAVREKRLREDVYYRLNVFELTLPPLRQRKEDLRILAETLITRLNEIHGTQVAGLDEEAAQKLTDHSWPGNIRELRNVIERTLITVRHGTIGPHDLPPELGVRLPQISKQTLFTVESGATLRQVEQAYIEYTLKLSGNNKRKTAKLLDISERTLHTRVNAACDSWNPQAKSA